MRRILLVEDDPELRLLVEHVLLDADYEVDVGETLVDGCLRLEQAAYDLVVADARLADGSGFVLARLAQAKGVAAIIMTGYAFVLNDPALDMSRYDVLLKPITPEELLASIANAFKQRS